MPKLETEDMHQQHNGGIESYINDSREHRRLVEF